MPLDYETLSKYPSIFSRLTGLKVKEFLELSSRLRPLWDKSVEMKKKSQGRPSNMRTFEDKLMALFIYYRANVTHEFIGYLFGIHNANVSRLFRRLSPLMNRRVTIRKDLALIPDLVMDMLETLEASKKVKKKRSA